MLSAAAAIVNSASSPSGEHTSLPSMRLSTGPYPTLRRRADYLLRHDPKRDLCCTCVVLEESGVTSLSVRALVAPPLRPACPDCPDNVAQLAEDVQKLAVMATQVGWLLDKQTAKRDDQSAASRPEPAAGAI